MARKKEPTRRFTSLLARFDKINLVHFGGHLCGGIGWRSFPLGKGKNLTLANCTFSERLIKVNSVLDDTRVPLWYLDFVLYHEMLHLQMGPQQFSSDGYGYPHSIRFQCLERSHADYERALKFEESTLDEVIKSLVAWRSRKTK